jgi:GPH family glycoside/pentoside/hexuronide:cation symporter
MPPVLPPDDRPDSDSLPASHRRSRVEGPPSDPARPPETLPEDRVPLSQKLGYGLGSFHDMWGHWLYPGLAFPVFNIYLGMSPAKVSLALFLNRIFDAVWDPVFGWLSDNTRTRFGRRRPYILVGSTLAGLALPFLFFVRPGWSDGSYFAFMLASSAIFIPMMCCFYTPYQSLGAELTPDYYERTRVFGYRLAIQKVPELAMFFSSWFTTLAVWTWAKDIPTALGALLRSAAAWRSGSDGKPDVLLGAQAYFGILGALMVVIGFVVFALVRERYYGKLAQKQEKVAIGTSLYEALKCKPFRVQLAVVLAYQVGTNMVGTLGFYDTVYYVCRGSLAEGSWWTGVMGIAGMILGFLGLPVYGAIAHRLGKIRGMAVVLGSALAVFVGTWWFYDPERRWLQPLASGFIAFTGAGFNMLDGSIGADIMDYDELESGKRREGAFTACKSFIMKMGMALGSLASGQILANTGFDAKLGASQSEHALFMIRFLLAAVPVAGILVALLAIGKLSLSAEAMADIRRRLEARRGAV